MPNNTIYYVDLDVNSNPGFLPNDQNNPMGWTEFKANTVATGNTYYLKGQRDDTSTTLSFSGNGSYACGANVTSWGTSPYRLRVNTINITGGGTFSNAAIECADQFSAAMYTINLTNVFLKCINQCTFNQWLDYITANVKGSTIITPNLRTTVHRYMNFTDSIFDVTTITPLTGDSASSTWTVRNCVFKTAKINNALVTWAVDSNNQFNWTPPTTWPAWNAAKEAFRSSITTKNITTPPQPGYGFPAFTGYAIDLFGEKRGGIGAVYYIPSSKINNGVNINRSSSTTIASSTLNTIAILDYPTVSSNALFSDPNNWNEVVVLYTHSSGQKAYVPHTKIGNDWVGKTTFYQKAQTGTWQKTKLILIDIMGASIEVGRSEIGSGEDITVV